METIKLKMVNIKMMKTVYGDIYYVKNAYWGTDKKWHFDRWETIPERHAIPDEWISRDMVLWETEIPTIFL